jgi:flagellar motor protein MotB
LDSEESRIAFDKDICVILKSFREDFIPLLEIYNFFKNQGQCDVLKKHFFLKGNAEDETTNDEIIEIPDEPVITINVEIIDNDNIYYSNIVKGVLNMMIANFDKDYMKHHFKSGFLIEFNRYTYYQSNSNELKKSLDNVIEDINRILDKDKLEKKKLFGTKIQKKDFKSIIEKACLEDDEDLLIQIYEESNSNDNIISKITDLNIKKYKRIITYINECLEINELKKLINNQNVKIEEQNVQIEKLNKDKNVQSDQLLKLNEKINELNKQRENQDDNIEQLNKKVGYMEIILNALISRKVINHSINKFLSKYKDSLKKTKKQIKKDGKIIEIPYIEVIKDINGVPSKDCQNLIDLLFLKKDDCNDCVHFNEIDKPSFVGDIWETVINFLKLTEKEKDIFNKIITDDIKKSFKFSQKDIRIEL